MRLANSVFLLAVCTLALRSASAAASDPVALSGVWLNKAPAARLVPTDGKALPFSAEGLARYQKNIAGLKDGSIVDKASYLCAAEGMPRAMTSAYPFQIMVTPGQLTFAHEASPFYRTVKITAQHADPEEWDPSYMGNGIAAWDGKTLSVDSTNFNAARIYLDATGLPASEQLHLVEKIELLDGGRQLRDTITIDDPVIFTRPWSARLSYERRTDIQLKTDSACGEPRRNLGALRKPGKPVARQGKDAVPARLRPDQLAMNGYWKGPSYAPPPGGAVRTGGAAPGTGPMAGVVRLMQPWAAAEFAKKVALEKSGEFVPTPTNVCIPAVVPGIGVPLGTEILVEPHQVTFLYELNRTARIVRIGPRPPAPPAPSWQGSSVGHWEGDTLVVETIGFNGKNVLANGVPMSDKMRIVQRLRMVAGKLEEKTTFDDPSALTAPFAKEVLYVPGSRFQEFVCAENNQQGGVPTANGSTTPYTLPKAGASLSPAGTDKL